MTIDIHAHFDDATNTVSYIVADKAGGHAAIIDPVLDYEPRSGRLAVDSADALLARVKQLGLTLDYVLETHAHADHLTAAHYIREKTGARVVIGEHISDVQSLFVPIFEADDIADGDGDHSGVFDILVADDHVLPLGETEIHVMHTPGHTPACLTYLIGDAAFVGDTLFMPDYGTARADFPGGDAATLYRSIRKILERPAATRIFVGHDYLPETRSQFAWETSVDEQRRANVHVHDGVSEEDFVAMRGARDAKLAAPTLILPAIQVNIRGGAMPPATEQGHVYLRIPVNGFPVASPMPKGLD